VEARQEEKRRRRPNEREGANVEERKEKGREEKTGGKGREPIRRNSLKNLRLKRWAWGGQYCRGDWRARRGKIYQ